MALLRESNTNIEDYATILNQQKERPYRLTPYIVTICKGMISEIDLRNFLEAGLGTIRFKLTHTARKDKVELLSMLKSAVNWCCKKYEARTWPIAISIDLPNACIRTGYMKDNQFKVYLEEGTIVEVTSDVNYWNQCDEKRIFIDDPYTIEAIIPNTEISVDFGGIIMICTKVVNRLSIKCKVISGGYLSHGQFVCVRGVKLLRPTLGRLDKQLLSFVLEYELDVITVHSVRKVATLDKIRSFFKGHPIPMIISTICEQEGLDNIDEIIAASDGIILAREFLNESLSNEKQLIKIQMQLSGKCKILGKPFYVSGNVLEETLKYGTISNTEISDVTNAVLQGAGLVLKNYSDARNLLTAMQLLNSVCKVGEAMPEPDDFWRLCFERPPPVNAADAIILSCAMIARQTESVAVVVLTVTGKTAVQLTQLGTKAIILSVSSNPRVAKQLQLYRGITPLIYDKKIKHWHTDMNTRVEFAISYGVTHGLLKYDETYVVLRKSFPTSAYCDQISLWNVVVEQNKQKRIECPDGMSHHNNLGPISSIW